ncbi:hypothetical protein [Hyphomicrobium sp.]|uniref:hypothetical protein n=1 Tax=Hyphomicrobium sp. TaxID=82 RepID=UPI0025C39038|nr:hypothetical protein [Hyphomicrobium sp.]
MDALARPRQNVVGQRRLRLLRRCSFAWRLEGLLQGADGVLECQPVGFQDLGRDASGVANDRGKHNCAVDIAPAAAPRRRCRRFKDATHLSRYAKRILWDRVLLSRLQNAMNCVAFDSLAADMARIEHGEGIGIVTQGGEQMLKRHL